MKKKNRSVGMSKATVDDIPVILLDAIREELKAVVTQAVKDQFEVCLDVSSPNQKVSRQQNNGPIQASESTGH